MKRRCVMLMLCGTLLLSGCSGESKQAEANSESVVIPVLEVPEQSKLPHSEISDIPEIEEFSALLQTLADELGIDDVKTLTYLSCKNADDGVNCSFAFPYKDSEAYAKFGYDGDSWLAVWVIDSKTADVYWVGDGMEEYLPPYAK